jgi:hypothetical protein
MKNADSSAASLPTGHMLDLMSNMKANATADEVHSLRADVCETIH